MFLPRKSFLLNNAEKCKQLWQTKFCRLCWIILRGRFRMAWIKIIFWYQVPFLRQPKHSWADVSVRPFRSSFANLLFSCFSFWTNLGVVATMFIVVRGCCGRNIAEGDNWCCAACETCSHATLFNKKSCILFSAFEVYNFCIFFCLDCICFFFLTQHLDVAQFSQDTDFAVTL